MRMRLVLLEIHPVPQRLPCAVLLFDILVFVKGLTPEREVSCCLCRKVFSKVSHEVGKEVTLWEIRNAPGGEVAF